MNRTVYLIFAIAAATGWSTATAQFRPMPGGSLTPPIIAPPVAAPPSLPDSAIAPFAPETPSAPSGPPPGGGDYSQYSDFVVPAYCYVEGSNDRCDIIDAAHFGWLLGGALSDDDKAHAVSKLLLEAAGSKLLILTFPRQMAVAEKIDIIRAAAENEATFFRGVGDTIQRNFNRRADPEVARQIARASSQEYESTVVKAVHDVYAASAKTVSNLEGRPGTQRVQSRCYNACKQLISIYRTGKGFD